MKVHANAANAYASRTQNTGAAAAGPGGGPNGERRARSEPPPPVHAVAPEPSEPVGPPLHRGQTLDLRV